MATKRLWQRYWSVLAAAAVLIPHALWFNFVNDDAYISFRYARNLAEHGQLVFNLGERVEGFTNFLWTVLLAAGMRLHIHPADSSRALGLLFGLITLVLTVRLSLRLDQDRPSPWHALAPLSLAAMGAFACWCMGGLETQLFTCLSLVAFERLLAETSPVAALPGFAQPTSLPRGISSAAWFALAAMTRPEGVLLFGVAGLFRLSENLFGQRRLRPSRQEVAWIGLFLALFGPYYAWRWRYYGWPFPNTFYVKSSGGSGTLQHGAFYLRRFAEDYGLVLLIPLVLLGWPRAGSRRGPLFRLTAGLWVIFALYTLKVGGDFMGLYRFVLPVVPLGAVTLQEALRTLRGRLRPWTGDGVLLGAAVAVGLSFSLVSFKVSRTARESQGAENGIDSPGFLKSYADKRIPIGKWFARYARPDDLMSVGGAGVIPYYAGIPAFDCYGLVDEAIAHDPTMTRDSRPGHQKWISDAHLFKRNPTLITHIYVIDLPAPYVPPAESTAYWAAHNYEWVSAKIPLDDTGARYNYYAFLKRKDRAFGPFPARP